MENISGNFHTTKLETQVVLDFLKKLKIDISSCSVEKFGQTVDGQETNARSVGDVYVKFKDKTFLLFEIKEESEKRINQYNQLGIDFISAFQFKPNAHFKSGIHNPSEYSKFIQSVDVNASSFKWGKLCYSLSDIWIFYCRDLNGNYIFLEGYSYRKMCETHFFEYLKNNCQFAINNKSSDQLSTNDTWCSATFFIDKDKMKHYQINGQEDLYYNDSNFTKRAVYDGITNHQCIDCGTIVSDRVYDFCVKHFNSNCYCMDCQSKHK